jgi:hypothetical protein
MIRFQMRRFLVVALIALGVGVSVAQPDEPVPPVLGTRVRLTVPSVAGKRLIGIVRDVDDAMLTLQRDGDKGTLQVPRSAITKVEVSRRRSRKGKGAVIGMLVGLGAAVGVGLAEGQDCGSPPEDDSFGYSFVFHSLCFSKAETAFITGVLTVPVGTLLGLVAAPREKWEVSSASRLKVAVAPVRGGGVRAAVTVRF